MTRGTLVIQVHMPYQHLRTFFAGVFVGSVGTYLLMCACHEKLMYVSQQIIYIVYSRFLFYKDLMILILL